MNQEYAGSYRIIGTYETVSDDKVCVGYNPTEALPYGVWISINNVLGSGEYFRTENEALNEMVRWVKYYTDNYSESSLRPRGRAV